MRHFRSTPDEKKSPAFSFRGQRRHVFPLHTILLLVLLYGQYKEPDKYQRNLFIAYLRNHHLSIETIDLRTVSIPSDRDIHHSQMHNRILIQLLCQQIMPAHVPQTGIPC